MQLRTLTLALIVGLSLRCPSIANNEIFATLVDRGLEVAPAEVIKLPAPILADGMNGLAQRKAIETLISGRYDWDTFVRKSVVSPLFLKISGGEGESNRVSRQVDLYFVAFGPLSKVNSETFLQEQLGLATADGQNGENGHVKVLNGEDLRMRGLPDSGKQDDARWVSAETTFLDKVRISLTTRNLKTQLPNAVLIASMADTQFNADAEYPNFWRPIAVESSGKRVFGPPQPYFGLGSYVKVTKLEQPADALFIEYHLAFAEPRDWFHGANLLRSKLPIVVQDMVRKFRRSLSAN